MAPFFRSLYSPRPRQSGFALLIVLSLLSLLVLLLVSMASLTRVETNISVASQSDAQARQNALTALNLAIGQLQRAAGPDQRITATAANTLSNTYPITNAEYRENPYWTGVWRTDGGAPGTFNAKFEQWLVNPANDAAAPRDLTDPAEAAGNKLALTATSNGPTGTDGVINLVGVGTGAGLAGSIVAAPPQGELGYNVPAANRAQFIDLKLDYLKAAGLPGFASTDYRTFGRIAWWTSDDGVKASLSGITHVDDITYDLGSGEDYRSTTAGGQERRERLTSLSVQGSRVDLALRNFIAPTDPVISALNVGVYGAMGAPASMPYISRIDNIRQFTGAVRAVGTSNSFGINFGAGGDDPSLNRSDYARLDERLRERFHDVAPVTFSVLSDTINGGLKKDFDAYASGSASLPANVQGISKYRYIRVAEQGTGTGQDILRSVIRTSDLVAPPSPIPANEPVACLGPLISECNLTINLVQDGAGGVNVSIGGGVQLWNPYNAILQNPNAVGDKWVLRVYMSDSTGSFPDINLSDNLQTSAQAMNLGRTLSAAAAFYDFALVAPAAVPDIQPGMARTWTLVPLGPLSALNSSGSPLAGFAPTAALGGQITVGTANDWKMQFSLVRSLGAPATDPEYHSISNISVSKISPSVTSGGLRYHVRLRAADEYGAGSTWLDDYDPRGPVVVASAGNAVDVNGGADPASYYSTGGAFDAVGMIVETGSASAVPLIIFDVPRQHITSVGYLAQMPYTAPNATSNVGVSRLGSAGTSLNDVFDSYYFSSVPGNGGGGWDPKNTTALPNTSLIVASRDASTALVDLQGAGAGLTHTDTAKYFLERDTLNVNSVSETAWRSLLGGCLPGLTRVWIDSATAGSTAEARLAGTWNYVNNTGTVTTANVANAFFRMPMTAAALEADYATIKADLASANANIRRLASYRLGIRELSNAQVDALARGVVSRIMARNQPFGSVRDFIDSNILQAAIDATTINSPGVTALDRFAPAFLTQADILQAIGHRLVARSDTFTIRAYGESTNPALDPTDANFVKGRAWVEAVVQRMPMKHSSYPIGAVNADDMTDTGATSGTHLGRQFRVISLRWLTPNDL